LFSAADVFVSSQPKMPKYEFGFRGLKPAKDWTTAERGKDKYMYYRRNVV
jgi:hypothetical protein